jgi:uncharacterized protein YndB with AHSA1/START domain
MADTPLWTLLMPLELNRYIGAVTRTVENRLRDGRPARVVVAERTYDTTVDDLWDALTTAERIPRWFLPVSGDLRLGGRYQLKGNAGGTITRCEPPRVVGLTWEMGGDISWVEVMLEPTRDGQAHLRLEHVAHVTDDRWDEYGPGAVGVGWDMALAGLGTHLATRAAVDSREAMAWLSSDDGKAFMRESSDGWCRASIDAGTDSAAASAAAARTTAAYTGESPSTG